MSFNYNRFKDTTVFGTFKNSNLTGGNNANATFDGGLTVSGASTFTGEVSGITKTMVGLSNVDNTTDLLKPLSTATQTALDLKSNLASPTFTGIPEAPTAAVSTDTTQLATCAFVLANSGGSGVNTATQTALDLKGNIASPTFTGVLTTSKLALTSTAINLGSGAASTTQGTNAIAVGFSAGGDTQGNSSVAIGDEAGKTTQGVRSVSVGYQTAVTNQGANSVAVGDRSATLNQGTGSVAIGVQSASTTQGNNCVAIGNLAGNATQALGSVAVGHKAGQNSQFSNSVAIGVNAGQTNLQTGGIAIGNSAGNNNCGSNSICIGSSTVATNGSSVAIGNGSTTAAFSSSVALGNGATATAANQIRLGTATETISIPGTLSNPGLTSALGLKANLADPVFTGTVSGITKTMVGLSNVDNTTDLLKPVSTATQTALNLKGNLVSPTFTGIPVAPTAAVSTNTTQVATTAFVIQNIASETAAQFDSKAGLNAPTFTGTVSANAFYNTDTGSGLATYSWVSSQLSGYLYNGISSATLTDPILTGIPIAPTAAVLTNTTQVATCEFVLANSGSSSSSSQKKTWFISALTAGNSYTPAGRNLGSIYNSTSSKWNKISVYGGAVASNWDSAFSIFTATEIGTYYFQLSVFINETTLGGRYLKACGTCVLGGDQYISFNQSYLLSEGAFTVSVMYYMAVGQTFYWYCQNQSPLFYYANGHTCCQIIKML